MKIKRRRLLLRSEKKPHVAQAGYTLGKFGKFVRPLLRDQLLRLRSSEAGGWSCAPSPNLAENSEGSLNGH